MGKVTQAEFDSLKNHYNEVRLVADSLRNEIKELNHTIAELRIKLELANYIAS